MELDLEDARSLGNALYPLLIEARANDKREARWGLRYPFFRAASIGTGAGNRYSAFSRDISASGIGLLHNMELPLGEVEISTTTRGGYSARIRTQIVQCRLCGEGWYMSGGQFVSPSSQEGQLLRNGLRPILLEAREDDERDDPARIRYPCFQPETSSETTGIALPPSAVTYRPVASGCSTRWNCRQPRLRSILRPGGATR